MNRSSKYYPLTDIIECSMSIFWEPIAAFNVDDIARRYMIDCAKANPNFSYRHVQRRGTKWVVVGEQMGEA